MNKNANKVIETVKKIVPYVIVIAILLALMTICAAVEVFTYNNGTHRGCGGKWVYSEAVGHKNRTGYIYECDKCGEHQEFWVVYRGK